MRLEINDPSRILRADFERTIVVRPVHRGSESLRDALLGKILDRTPYWKGGLQRDETGKFNSSNYDDPMIVTMYTETDDQIAAWHRVYAHYVEGGPLGDYSPTIEHPSKMFWRTTDDDFDYIADWFETQIQHGINDLVSGRGLRR